MFILKGRLQSWPFFFAPKIKIDLDFMKTNFLNFERIKIASMPGILRA